MGKRRKRQKYKPYEQVKYKWFSMPDPLGDTPIEERTEIAKEIGVSARKEFESKYPLLVNWFEKYDAPYLLAYCVHYFLAAEQGVDKEAIAGRVDFGPVHLEVLQAIALMRPRSYSGTPLQEQAEVLKDTMKSVIDALGFSAFDVPEDAPESEAKKQWVL